MYDSAGLCSGDSSCHVIAASERVQISQHAPLLTLVSHQSRTEKHSVNIFSDSLSTLQYLCSAVLWCICTLQHSAVLLLWSICTLQYLYFNVSALCSICTLKYSAISVLCTILTLLYLYYSVSVLYSVCTLLYSAVSVLYYEDLDEAVRVSLQVEVYRRSVQTDQSGQSVSVTSLLSLLWCVQMHSVQLVFCKNSFLSFWTLLSFVLFSLWPLTSLLSDVNRLHVNKHAVFK